MKIDDGLDVLDLFFCSALLCYHEYHEPCSLGFLFLYGTSI